MSNKHLPTPKVEKSSVENTPLQNMVTGTSVSPISTKKRTSINLDAVLYEQFKTYCKKNHYSISGLLEDAIKNIMIYGKKW